MESEDNEVYPYVKSLQIMRIIVGVISLIPCVIVAFFFLTKRKVREKFYNKLSFMLSISCFGQSCCYFIYYSERSISKLCHWQGTLLTSFFFISLILTTIIGMVTYMSFFTPDVIDGQNSFKIIVSIFPWVMGLIFGILVYLRGWDNKEFKPGKSLLCWYESKPFYSAVFIIDIVLLITNALLICLLMFKILQILKSNSQEKIFKHYFRILIWHIIVQILVFLPLLVTGYFVFVDQWEALFSQKWWNFTQDLVEGLSGFLFSAVYGYTPEIKFQIFKLFGKEVSIMDDDDDGNERTISLDLIDDYKPEN